MTVTRGHVVDLDVHLECDDVLRMMGCRKDAQIDPPEQALLDRLILEAGPLLKPRGIYAIHSVDRMTDSELILENCPLIRGPIASFLRPAQRVAAFVVTVGEGVEELALERDFENAPHESAILNAIGSAAVEAAVDTLADIIYFGDALPNEALTPPFCPGHCGLPIDEQISLFAIINPKEIGVRLLSTMATQPIKSVSGLIGIGPSDQVEAHGVPCQWCDVMTCHMQKNHDQA
ncbi:MAG: hypothetical protein FWC56_04320 [Phycisphaerae bacterium]|nr:hypothetical protein [Phycisphaerae bacterium]